MTPRLLPTLEIGGTHVTAALVCATTWRVVAASGRRQALDPHGTAPEILADVIGCANGLGAAALDRWGVALPGPFDYASGIGLYEGVAKFEALNGVDMRAALLGGLRPPASAVVFINDADAFLLGEWIAGAAAGHRRAVGITLGTGVGSAFLVDGEVVDDDPAVPPQGRVDLLTVAGRRLEETISRRAIVARYTDLAELSVDTLDVRDVAERARGGDPIARQVLDEAFTALGETLAPWLMRFGASILVVGGSITASWDLIARPLHAALLETAPTLQVARAREPDQAALIGAAWCAFGQSAM
jgi:glucokinase